MVTPPMALLFLSCQAWFALAWTSLLYPAPLLPSSVGGVPVLVWMGCPEFMHKVLPSSSKELSLCLASVLFDPGPLVGLYLWMAVSTYTVFFVSVSIYLCMCAPMCTSPCLGQVPCLSSPRSLGDAIYLVCVVPLQMCLLFFFPLEVSISCY